MEWALLCTLVLLMTPRGTSVQKEGETCRSWMYARESSARPFQCPEELDSKDATFCCGTCALPYCCSSKEDRLDQEKCSNTEQPKEDTGPLVELMPYMVRFLQYFFATLVAIAICLAFCCFCPQSVTSNELEDVNQEIDMEYLGHPATDPDASSTSPPALDNTPGGENAENHEGEATNLTAPVLVDTLGCDSMSGPGMDAEDSAWMVPHLDGEDVRQAISGVDGEGSEQMGPRAGGESLEQMGSGAEGDDLDQMGPGLDEEEVDLKVPGVEALYSDQTGPNAKCDSSDQTGLGMDGKDSYQTMPGLEGGDSDQVGPGMDWEDSEWTVSGPESGDLDQMEPGVDGENFDLMEPGMLRVDSDQPRPGTERHDLMQPGLGVDEEDSEM